jgi:translation initiation factor IF-2
MRDFRGSFRAARVSQPDTVQQTGTLRRAALATLLLPWIVSTTGCLVSSAKPAPRAFRPPPVEAKAVVVIPEVPILEEGGPSVNGPEPLPNPAELATIPIPQFPEPPKPPSAKPRAPAPPKATAPVPTPAPPKITQLFTQEQSDELNRSYDEFLGQIKRDLELLGHRRLRGDQSAQVSRIRTFEDQAKQEHDRDLVTAVELAKRAASLAEDLVSRLR